MLKMAEGISKINKSSKLNKNYFDKVVYTECLFKKIKIKLRRTIFLVILVSC